MNSIAEHRSYGPEDLGVAILTASDSRTEDDDDSGRIVAELVAEAGFRLVDRRIVKDERSAIRRAVEAVVGGAGADVVIINGGTGFSPRDVTVEALAPLFEREIEGFGQLFRALSYEQVGAAAMLSRATAGVIGHSVVFALPGSPRAVELALRKLILPEVRHLLGQIRR